MPKRTPDQLRYWSETNKVIGQKLRAYYQACTTEKLLPELLAVLKKLDEEVPQAHGLAKSDSK
jgi:hypothetical protein